MTLIETPQTYEPCGTCAAPLGDNQRYCVVCGTNRRHPEDPVARHLAAQAAAVRRAERLASAPVRRRGGDRVTAVALALIPVAAAVGVMVGQSGRSSTADEQLLAALRARPAGTAAAAGATAAATTALTGDFGLAEGYTVEIGTLPWDTTTEASARKAKDAAKAKGAKGVGIINPDDFSLTPDSGGDYVLYSGEYKSKADATKALGKLKRKFPDAKVLKVGASVASAAGGASASTSSAGSKLAGAKNDRVALQKHATAQQKAQGAAIVKQIQADSGKSYVERQRQLPDTIVIP